MVEISVARLSRHCNPLLHNPWGCKTFCRAKVKSALASRRLVATPGTDDHAGRVAFLVEHEAADAIEIDVGIPALNYWPGWLLLDGNHRLAAAIYARRRTILAQVDGQMDYAYRLLGCTDYLS